MSEPAAILATFTDFDLVQTRKVAKLVFEVPIEEFKAALDTLGMPEPAGGTWCGIARVTKPAGGTTPKHPVEGQPSSREAPPPAVHQPLPPKSKHDLLSNRAWKLLVNDDFRTWLNEMNEAHGKQWGDSIAFNPIDADAMLKRMLDIESKKELDSNNGKANEFRFHIGSFYAWRQARGHARAA